MDFQISALEPHIDVPHLPHVGTYADRLEVENQHLKKRLRDLRRYVGELEQAVDQDPLMPVYNRRAFMRELSRAQSVLDRYDIPSCVIYLDLDRFKAVNDQYGHCVGDELLRKVGEILQSGVRECDMVARLGGDEFGVLLFKTHPKIAEAKAAALACRISEIEVGTLNGTVKTTAAWGVSTCAKGKPVEHILACADQNMYAVKREKAKA